MSFRKGLVMSSFNGRRYFMQGWGLAARTLWAAAQGAKTNFPQLFANVASVLSKRPE